ncbi:galactose mutarotase-like domain-containing protein [Mycena vulgaris]|nr:galactose mutarotase-like domain-containing protein [Mycena vulgaris]
MASPVLHDTAMLPIWNLACGLLIVDDAIDDDCGVLWPTTWVAGLTETLARVWNGYAHSAGTGASDVLVQTEVERWRTPAVRVPTQARVNKRRCGIKRQCPSFSFAKSHADYLSSSTTAEPTVGELRFIARLSTSTAANGPIVYNVNGGTAIEASNFIEDQVHGATGSGIGVYMCTGYELSSGGPFMRDIDNQNGGDQEVYFYMSSGHTEPEAYRQGFHGPYALWFTTGAAPSAALNTTFWATLGTISGFVAEAGRGRVTGKASNFRSAHSTLLSIGWSNSADSAGNFVSSFMKPGTYTMTLYEVELAVGSTSVTVSAGGNTAANIASTLSLPTTIWTIGDYDGTPRGFLNADKIETMHIRACRPKAP